jgi:hypothetical protein
MPIHPSKALPTGVNELTAVYSGDTIHESSVSAQLLEIVTAPSK